MRDPKGASYPSVEHFGELVRGSKFGHKMTRGMYAYPNRKPKELWTPEALGEDRWAGVDWAYRDAAHTEHSDAYLLVQRDAALVNFDLSMRYFESLDEAEFEVALEHVLAKGRTFKPVESLKDWDGAAGAYVMVFDEYRQFYIGQASDTRKRIKQHWGGRKPFDRLVFGSKYESIFPVDELRALDTTRIFAARSRNPYAAEERAEKAADQRFCLNRMMGGEPSPLKLMLAAADRRSRVVGVPSASQSGEDFDREWDGVGHLIERSRSSGGSGLVGDLVGLDMAVFSVAREDGAVFLWSRRDAVSAAVARGELSVGEFVGFLEGIGEVIVWPED